MNHPDARLVALADPSREGSEYAATLGVTWHADYRDMLEDDDLDGVIVAVPNALHVAAGMACLEKDLPMLMEKPVADTIAGAQALVSASTAKDVPILVGHHRRHSPDILEGRRAIQASI
ncbi:4-carboxy-2-hydroxymuconate-6-semialdehyde dehydrogenase [Castellaniella defragrans]